MSYDSQNFHLRDTIQKSDKNIDTFKKFGFMRPNRFEVEITSPPTVKSAIKQIQFHVKEISLPDRTLRTVMNSNQYGPAHDIVQGQTYGSLNTTFYLDSKLTEKLYFEEWQKSTFDTNTYNLNYYRDYVGSMEIYTLNEQDERTHGVKVHECFPDTINSIALSQDANTSVGTIGVGFKYRYFSTIGKEFESNPIDYGPF